MCLLLQKKRKRVLNYFTERVAKVAKKDKDGRPIEEVKKKVRQNWIDEKKNYEQTEFEKIEDLKKKMNEEELLAQYLKMDI